MGQGIKCLVIMTLETPTKGVLNTNKRDFKVTWMVDGSPGLLLGWYLGDHEFKPLGRQINIHFAKNTLFDAQFF
ncbi:hypothetical protein QML37_30040 [Klebsiella pneumoniae]|uniref:hypothetical protein n=1 Tax=Klebsiella pneumoniae TaxID=573 RepID=UPI003A800B3D